MDYIVREVEGFFKVIKLKEFRRTEGVKFDIMIKSMVPKVDAIDRVLHKESAISPGPVGDVERTWYMHPYQEDNIMVLSGKRNIELYMPEHGRVEKFVITPDYISHNGELIVEGGGIITWSTNVFHRIESGEDGSASINLASHHPGFDIETNFNIYDLDTETGSYRLLREGHKDQK